MIQIAYVSSTFPLLTGPEIADILIKSRANNGRLGITGILLYRSGNVLQVLEGEEEAVLALFAVIQQDKRHRGVIQLFKKRLTEPDFPDWKMAFRDLNSKEVANLEGVGEVNDPAFDMLSLAPDQADLLLRKFKARPAVT